MIDVLALDLVFKKVVTNQLVLTIGYDVANINDNYKGDIVIDHYGRCIPKHSTGRIKIDHYTSSSKILIDYIMKLFEQIINKDLLVRRINITLNDIRSENINNKEIHYEQYDIFSDTEELEKKIKLEKVKEKEERNLQRVMINIKEKY